MSDCLVPFEPSITVSLLVSDTLFPNVLVSTHPETAKTKSTENNRFNFDMSAPNLRTNYIGIE